MDRRLFLITLEQLKVDKQKIADRWSEKYGKLSLHSPQPLPACNLVADRPHQSMRAVPNPPRVLSLNVSAN